jgi:hypothetical protein
LRYLQAVQKEIKRMEYYPPQLKRCEVKLEHAQSKAKNESEEAAMDIKVARVDLDVARASLKATRGQLQQVKERARKEQADSDLELRKTNAALVEALGRAC